MNVALTEGRAATSRQAGGPGGRSAFSPGSVDAAALVRPAWWMWPHLLSLDAPLVAVVWQRWWAHGAGITLSWSREVILALGVWLIYLADRLADTTGDRWLCSASRHVFSARYRNFLLPLTGGIALILIGMTPFCLPAGEFLAGLGLLTLALGHFWLSHGWPSRGWAAYVPKEAVVGALFSVGSVFFVACRSPHFAGISGTGIVLFAGVCFGNCALITHWERHAEDLRERSSLLNAFPRFSARLGLVCVLLAAVALAVRSALLLPIAASALLLAALDHYKRSIPVEALRVLADLVLLTPCLLLWG